MDHLPAFIIDVLLSFYYMFESIYRLAFPRRAKDVSKDIVLITGGGNGLGRALAFQFIRRGARVVLWDVDVEGLDETVKSLNQEGGRAWKYVVDVTDKEAVRKATDQVKEDVGLVSILVNNAGVVSGKRFLELSDDEITRTFQVNSISHFWTTKAFLPDMLAFRQGQVVTIASVAGHFGAVQLVDYCASKHAAVGFSDALRKEIKTDGYEDVHVTEISPYYINTKMFTGVEPGTMNTLDVDKVAAVAMKGILVNQERVYIPHVFSFLVVLKDILPFKSIFALEKALGEGEAMVRFIGRQIEEAKGEPEPSPDSEATPSEQSPSGDKPPVAESSASITISRPVPSEQVPKPSDPEPKPSDPESKPVDADPIPASKPSEPEQKPAEPEPKPSDSEPKPTDPETNPVEGEPMPGSKPSEADQKPVESDSKPMEPESKPVEAEPIPASKPSEPEQKPSEPESKPNEPEPKPVPENQEQARVQPSQSTFRARPQQSHQQSPATAIDQRSIMTGFEGSKSAR